MYYSAIGLLAILVLLIENQGTLLNPEGAFEKPVWRLYRRFLLAVLIYYITDVLWGFLESRKLGALLFADTTLYFVAMAAGVLYWARFTVAYLGEENEFGRFIVHAGRFIAGVITLLAAVNTFAPVLFTVDGNSVYHALPVRYVILSGQILTFLLVSAYAFLSIAQGRAERIGEYRTLAFFGLVMAIFLFIQLWFPYLPLYTIAYLLGTCLLRTFVVDDVKEKYRRGLEETARIAELKDTIVSLLDNSPA